MPRHRPYHTLLAALAGALIVGGCRAAPLAYGSDAASAKAHFDAFAAAIEYRFTRVVRNPKFATARMQIARYAFAPSKLAGDTALWTGLRTTRTGADRDLEVHAALSAGQFRFTARPGVALPIQVGDERHLIALDQLGPGDWQWRTAVDHAVGTMPPARADDIARALFHTAERPAAAIRADYRAVMPRTAASLGRLLALDSIATVPQADGSTVVTLRLSVSGDRLVRTLPAFAKYIKHYVEPARYRFRLADRSGADWFDAEARDRVLTLRFRSHEGQLQPLLGAARRMPDSLRLHVDALAKISLFTVGVTRMEGEFVHVRTPRERGWAMRFTKDPEWHLPLIAERLLRTPLRRPFEGTGVVFSLGLRTGPEGQTLLARTFDMAVRESAIMRFLGTLGFTAMSDYAGTVEDEENRFIAEVMAAMRADVRALGAK
ncbi:MAG: hypothetical protein P3C10_05680 [Gemmatimonadota bacterium]|nr:hypothetical protein [Gemmatimonadota bacterium]